MIEKNIAVVTVLFNPATDTADNIKTYLPFFSRVYLIDNSSKNNLELLNALDDYKISYRFDGNNEGLSKRLNEVADIARVEGFSYLLTMDQDSSFDEKMLTDYLECIESFAYRKTVAMYGVEPDKRLLQKGNCNAIYRQMLITSGSLINLEIHSILKGFDENLFIDFVDTEYCLRAIKNGFDTIKFRNILMNHAIGINKVFHSLKTFQKTSRSLHTPQRVYYMFRNYLYTRKLYKMSNEEVFRGITKNVFISLKNNLIYNKDRLQVFRNIIIAFFHHKINKMGKWMS